MVHQHQNKDQNPSPAGNPFVGVDADVEWSDEEELLPKRAKKRDTPYMPPEIKLTPRLSISSDSSDESDESPEPNPNRLRVNGSPFIPPKSPSRPDVRPGSSQEDLVARFYAVTRERDALRKELQRKSLGPNGDLRASVVYKSDEKTLIEDLLGLREEIRLWTEEYFTGPLPSRRRPQLHLHTAKELFGSLTDNYNSYLKHPEDRPLLMQAFLWSRLQQRIFSTLSKGCGYVWAGKLGDRKLRPINDTLRKGIFFPRSSLPSSYSYHLSAVKNEEQAEDYHRWRALTVNLLVPQVDGKWSPTYDATPVLKWIRRFCSRIRRRLRPWATQSLRTGKEQLYTIVSAAVALDLKMKRQRADYRFITWTGGKPTQFWGYGFYESEMEDLETEDEDGYRAGGSVISSASRVRRRVELSLAPALERCGNANGHVFDQNFILVKADVTCRRLERVREVGKRRKGFFGRAKS